MTIIDPTSLPVVSDLAKRLQGHVEYLASPALKGRQPGTAGNRQAADYLVAQFREIGLPPLPSLGGYRQTITMELGDNLIAYRPGRTTKSAAPWILIAAHFDHLGGSYLGADDNASAVAILLETARRLPPLAHHQLLIAAFNTEEPPYIRTSTMGSQVFVDHLPEEIGATSRIRAAIVMDLMGGAHWSATKEAIFAGGAEKSPGLYRRLTARSGNGRFEPAVTSDSSLTVLPIGIHLIEELPLLGRVAFSDYNAFRNHQVPFIFLSSGRTPRYHQVTDLPNTLHYERMAATVDWLTHMILDLDQDTDPYEFLPGRIEFADELKSMEPLIRLAGDKGTMIPGTSALSLWKIRSDLAWLERVDSAAPTHGDITRLEHATLRLQCLLADFPGCFLL